MKAKEVIDLLKNPEATVRISVRGEMPLEVKAVAIAQEDNFVLMAVPEWGFSELDQALAMAPRAKDGTWVDWDSVFCVVNASDSSKNWKCREHGSLNCSRCKTLTVGGFHNGVENQGRFCNCHSKATCPDAIKDPLVTSREIVET